MEIIMRLVSDQNLKSRFNRALKESIADTSIAFCLNVPLNFILITFAFNAGLSAIGTTILLTTVFTLFAIVRKTYIRMHFENRNSRT